MSRTERHRTRAVAGQGIADPLLGGIELSEWRLVGPGLAALIVALALRFRLWRARIQEFLAEWLGLQNNALLQLALFHTLFNALGVLLFMPWHRQLAARLEPLAGPAPKT